MTTSFKSLLSGLDPTCSINSSSVNVIFLNVFGRQPSGISQARTCSSKFAAREPALPGRRLHAADLGERSHLDGTVPLQVHLVETAIRLRGVNRDNLPALFADDDDLVVGAIRLASRRIVAVRELEDRDVLVIRVDEFDE